MRILLFGKNGQVGWELQQSLLPLGELIALDRQGGNTGLVGDLKNLEGIAATIRSVRPDVIVNAAAYTAVDKAESEQQAARMINALAPAVMAQVASELNAWFVHYSTDYVFDGSGEHPWREDDATGPLSVYGQTKLEGEQAVQRSGSKHLIFRTSWVYGTRGGNFAKTMLRLGRERDKLTVIDDQIGAPTGADLIANVTAHAIRTAQARPEVSGLYHLVANGQVTWHGYAKMVLETARKAGIGIKVKAENILPIPTSSYPTPAKRPANSRLATVKLTDTFDLNMPAWQIGVERMLAEVLEKQS